MNWIFSFILPLAFGVNSESINGAPSSNIDLVKFDTRKLFLGKLKLTVEIADTDAKRERGLMYRDLLAENHGMLFIFEDEHTLNFWMKNTFIDLDIGFFDRNKKLVDIQTMKGVKSVMETEIPSYPSLKPAQYALEMRNGWFEKNKIKLGATFILK